MASVEGNHGTTDQNEKGVKGVEQEIDKHASKISNREII